MNTIQEQFTSLLLTRRQSELSLTDSFLQAQKTIEKTTAHHQENDDIDLLTLVSKKMLELIEQNGQDLASKGLEPAYHNRQHFADAVLVLSFLLTKITELTDRDKYLMLLAMLVHDFGHRGISSNLLNGMTHEEETIALLKDTAINLLPLEQQEEIFELITGTTTNLLSKTNTRYISEPTNLRYLKQALINDADIATSYIPNLGQELTKYILIESGNSHPSEQDISDAYSAFRKQFSLTSQIAKSIFPN